jgi:hypothetical protein
VLLPLLLIVLLLLLLPGSWNTLMILLLHRSTPLLLLLLLPWLLHLHWLSLLLLLHVLHCCWGSEVEWCEAAQWRLNPRVVPCHAAVECTSWLLQHLRAAAAAATSCVAGGIAVHTRLMW